MVGRIAFVDDDGHCVEAFHLVGGGYVGGMVMYEQILEEVEEVQSCTLILHIGMEEWTLEMGAKRNLVEPVDMDTFVARENVAFVVDEEVAYTGYVA